MKKIFSRRQFLGATFVTGAAAMAPFPSETASSQAVAASLEPQADPVKHGQDQATAVARYEEIALTPIYKTEIRPHWLAINTKFWYRNDLADGKSEFVLVDAISGTRQPAFDCSRVAEALSKNIGKTYDGDRLPFRVIEFDDAGTSLRFDVDSAAYVCSLSDYNVRRLPVGTALLSDSLVAQGIPAGDDREADARGTWSESIVNYNVALTDSTGVQRLLTTDGTEDRPYGALSWSPDFRRLVAYRIDPAVIKKVYMVESSPKEWSSRGVLHEHEYAQPGDPFSKYEMWLFDAGSGEKIRAQVDVIDFGDAPDLRWDEDSSWFTYECMDRGYQRFRIVAVDAMSGKSTTIVNDKAQTFIDSTNQYTWYSDDRTEVVYASERDGWRHLYLYDGRTGSLKNQITEGKWVVRSVDRVDHATRQIWFSASGMNHGEDPYHIHKYRIRFDGSAMTALTAGNGTHKVQFSPDDRFLIDSYSRADCPPMHALRSAVDGKLICRLESSDVSGLLSSGWRPPEVFSAKGRDGVTDIWGIVFRPLNFKPWIKYPVIENIYAGPHDSFVRKSFSVCDSMQALAELGFIVVQCDGMGTRNRSKAFHDVCWRNIKDAGFPDRIEWITALGRTDASVDVSRVGIYGTSAGGQNSTGALLFHPEFYKAAVSSCGCHDNRIDKQWWNEQWMGYPVGPWYDENSNITNAGRLLGRLMLIVGELDTNVPPESTLRLTNALMNAGKDFDLIVITGSDHTDGGEYGERRRRDFFIRHLQKVEPPNRNIPTPPPPAIELVPRPVSFAENVGAGAGSATTIRFVNKTKEVVSLYWVSGDGSRTFYATVAPGESYQQGTYAGHVWLVTGEKGDPLEVFVGAFQPGIANIRM